MNVRGYETLKGTFYENDEGKVNDFLFGLKSYMRLLMIGVQVPDVMDEW